MKHYVHFDTRPYKAKPAGKEVGRTQNYVLKQSQVEQLTIHEIIERATNGRTLIASKLDGLREVEATSLVFIDIDDEKNVTKLNDFKEMFGGRLAAYYYSFSHIEGTNNRLRLIFQLEEALTPALHSFIAGELIKEVQAHYEAKNIDITGIIDETASKGSKRLWFGTSKGGAVLDDSACIGILAIDHYKNKFRKETDSEVRLKQRKRIEAVGHASGSEVTFDELKAMAETIGGIPSGPRVEWMDGETVSANEAWSDLINSIRHYEKEGFISEAESFELCEMVSGDGLSIAKYNGFNPDGSITIGTFIKYAIQRGYHFNNSFKEDTDAYSLPADKKHVVDDDGKGYVSKDFMKGLLQKPVRALVDSPTGSGKTYATVEAMKELAAKGNRSHVYIIASPTRALAAQIAREREIRLVIGGTGNSEGSLKGSWQKGERVFSSTYDQVQKIIESVPANELILVVDEVHKLTTDREFRNDTIQKVIDAAEKARTFIGITGTSADVYELMFDEKHTVKVKTSKTSKASKAAIPASDFHVLEYTTAVPDGKGGYKTDKGMELLAITQLVKSEYKKRGIRSLVFINNKKLIDEVATELEKDGMNVFKVYRESSEDKNSRAYEKVVANDIDDDVDVILATKRIADGISLTFDPFKWNVVVLSDNRTRTFNPSEVRQMFHRIRSKYRFAVLITRLPERQSKINKKAVRYHKNRHLNVLHRRAKEIKKYFDDLMIHVTEDDFYKLEKAYGLYAKDGEVHIDLNVLNAEAVQEKELYYSRIENRELFIAEVAAGIGFQSKIKRNVFDYTLPDVDELLNGLEAEEEKPTAETLQKRFVKFYTLLVHESLRNGDTESVLGTNDRLLEEYRKQYGEARINAMLDVARTVESHEKARGILAGITRRKEQNYFMDRLQVRNTHHEFFRRKRNKRPKSYTQTLYERFSKEITKQTYSSAALRELKKELGKKHRIGAKDVNAILKLFTTIEEEVRSRQKLYTLLDFDTSIEAGKFGMNLTEFDGAAISLLNVSELKEYAIEIEVLR